MAGNSAGSIFVDLLLNSSKYTGGLNQASKQTSDWSRRTSSEFKSSNTAIQSVSSSIGRLATIAASAFSVQKILQYSDSYRNLQSRLSLVTDSSQELANTTRELFQISQENAQPLEATIDAYTRLENSLTDSQKASTDLIKFTDLLSKTLLISGADAAGAATFFQQFGQAASSDFKAIGQELQTFADQNPRFYQILRDEATKYGKTLKQMAADGELSFKFVSDAVANASGSIEGDAGRIAQTVGKSFTQLNNSLLSFIGNSEDVKAASSFVSEALQAMSQSIDEANENGLSLKVTMVGLSVAFLEFYKNAVNKYAVGFEAIGFDTSKYKERANAIQVEIDRIGMLLLEDQENQKKANQQAAAAPRAPRPDAPAAVDEKALKKAAQEAKRLQSELQSLYSQNETYITGLNRETISYNQTITELTKLLDNGKISQSQYNDAIGRAREEYEKTQEAASLWAFDVDAATKRAAENIQDNLADFLFDPFEKGLKGMLLGFVQVLQRMAAEAAAAQILKSIFGGATSGGGAGVGGFLSGLFGSAGSTPKSGVGPVKPASGLLGFFDGFFADGGFIQPGHFGIAGEAGAEIVMGGRSGATVIPNKGMGGNTYNIDARGADQGAVRRIEQALLSLAGPGVIESRVNNAQSRGEIQ